MAQYIKQGNIAGRIGTGIGKGLAEQAPKEIERHRLASGLKELGNKQGLTPFQQFAALSSVPGVTPQMIQSGSELLKQQGIRNSYAQRAGRQEGINPKAIQDVRFANLDQGPAINKSPESREYVKPEDYGQPQIVEKNPLRQEVIPAKPWTQEQRDDDIARTWEQNPQLTLPEIINLSADNERRAMAQPEAIRAQDEYFKKVQGEVEDAFNKQLNEKLEKNGEGVYKDITGEMLSNIKRSIAKELRTNPNATVEDVVNKWTTKALDLAKTKKELDVLAGQGLIDRITNRGNILDNLKSYQKTFAETGNQEEYFNKLQSDLKLSPQGAAYIAYPRSKKVSDYIKKITPSNPKNFSSNARKYAADLEDLITSNDSFLAIARELKEKDPFFDQSSFFNQIREDRDNLPLNPRQKRDIDMGERNTGFPNWADISIFLLGR